MASELPKALKGFSVHGVDFIGESGEDQAVGSCPFCGKEGRFYVNINSRLWDCKGGSCGRSGNFNTFLKEVADRNRKRLQQSGGAKRRLAQDRDLSITAMSAHGVGWDGSTFTIPVRAPTGTVVDIRRYFPDAKGGRKTRSTPGAKSGLWGADQLADASPQTPVYLCEGEWDGMALDWLRRKTKQAGVVVAVPGADTFKKEWAEWLTGRRVTCLYDNDQAGWRGQERVGQALSGVARELRFVHWPTKCPTGWDVRDWVVKGAVALRTPRACWRELMRNVEERPMSGKALEVGGKKVRRVRGRKKRPEAIGREALVSTFQQWLHMSHGEDPMAVVFGTLFANQFEGDPIWLFLVAPPGGSKSEYLMAVGESEMCHQVSSLTPHALVSGMNFAGQGDPSLMPQLDGKVLIIKDFTVTLSQHPSVRDEIFGQLRDAYDGHYEKAFGNGVVRSYDSKFGIVAGVTPSIDEYASLHQGLGERFLKFRMERHIGPVDEEARIIRALRNNNHEHGMRRALQAAATAYLDGVKRSFKTAPRLSPSVETRMVKLAMFTARLRGIVHRDIRDRDVVTSKATFEVGTRLAKQLSKLAQGIAVYFGARTVNDRCMRLAVQVALSSIPDKVEEIVRVLYLNRERAMGSKDITDSADRLTFPTVFRTLEDLRLLGLIDKVSTSKRKHLWRLTQGMEGLCAESGVFDAD